MSGSYVLDAAYDAASYEQYVAEARSASIDRRTVLLDAAAALWRGPAFDGAVDGSLILERRFELAELRGEEVVSRAEDLSARGAHAEALSVALPAWESDTAREPLALIAANALGGLGRRNEALDVLRRCRNALIDVGLEPTNALSMLEGRVLEVGVELSSPGSSNSPAPVISDFFVGRQAEIRELVTPGPGIDVIIGDAGLGKTSLVDQTVALLADRGVRIVRAAGRRSAGSPMEVVATWCEQLIEADPDLATPQIEAALGRLGRNREIVTTSVATTREAMFVVFSEFLLGAAPADSSVLFLDDAHWADRGTAELIEVLIRRHRCRIVVTSRPAIPAYLGFLDNDIDPRIRRFRLQPLTVAEVAEFVRRELPGRDVSTVEIHRRTGGNPLFLALLTTLMADGVRIGDGELPSSVLVAVQRLLMALSDEARETVHVASVFGDVVPIEVIESMVPGSRAHLQAAYGAGLASRCDDELFEFAHSLVREGAYQMVAPGRRTMLHDEIGRALEAAGAPSTAFAFHAEQAADFDPVRAVETAATAAADVARSFAWDSVERWSASGLATAGKSDSASDLRRAQLLLLKGTALRALNQAESDEVLLESVTYAKKADDATVLAQGIIQLSGHGRISPDDPTGEDLYQTAVELLEGDDLEGSLQSELAAGVSTLVSVSRHQASGTELFRRGMALASEIGDPDLEARVLMRLHLGLPLPEAFDERVGGASRLLDIAGDDPDLRWEATYLQYGIGLTTANVEVVEQCIDDLRLLTPQLRLRGRNFGLLFAEAARFRFYGDLDRAEDYLNQSLSVGLESFAENWVTYVYFAIYASIAEARGTLAEVMPAVQKEMDLNPPFPTWHVIAAASACAAGDEGRVRDEIGFLRSIEFKVVPDLSWMAAMAILAEPIEMIGDLEAAALLRDHLAPFSGRMVWNGMCTHRPVDAALSVYERLLGNEDEASRLTARSKQLGDRIQTFR